MRAIDELRKSEARIREMQASVLVSSYEMGVELRRVYDRQLWKARGKFKSFREWCTMEMGFTTTWAQQLMKVSRDFSPEQVARVGASKLALLGSLPPSERGPLVERICNEGLGQDALREIVIARRLVLLNGQEKRVGRPPVARTNGVSKVTLTLTAAQAAMVREWTFAASGDEEKDAKVIRDELDRLMEHPKLHAVT